MARSSFATHSYSWHKAKALCQISILVLPVGLVLASWFPVQVVGESWGVPTIFADGDGHLHIHTEHPNQTVFLNNMDVINTITDLRDQIETLKTTLNDTMSVVQQLLAQVNSTQMDTPGTDLIDNTDRVFAADNEVAPYFLSAKVHSVRLVSGRFIPAELHVYLGDYVEFTWSGSEPLTINEMNSRYSSTILEGGRSSGNTTNTGRWKVRFTRTGTFGFRPTTGNDNNAVFVHPNTPGTLVGGCTISGSGIPPTYRCHVQWGAGQCAEEDNRSCTCALGRAQFTGFAYSSTSRYDPYLCIAES